MEGESTIAYEHKNEKLPRKDTRASFLVRVLFSILLLVIIISSIFIATLRSDKYQFSDVKVFGPITFSSDDVVNFTREYWSGHYFKTIPKTSTIFFSKDDFEKQLRARFPVIEMAYVTLPAPDVLEINIKEHAPKIVWCLPTKPAGLLMIMELSTHVLRNFPMECIQYFNLNQKTLIMIKSVNKLLIQN
jgi:cell division septal protein FtsQ